MNHVAIEKAFTKATLAATQILRFAVEHPGRIAKSEDPTVQAKAVSELAGALSREVARYALGPTYAEYQVQKAEWRAKFEAKQARIAASHVACSETPCELCVIAKDEQEMYDRIVDKAAVADNRPHLDSTRAETEADGPPAVPWRETIDDEDEKPAHVEAGVSKRILDEAGFDDDGGGVFKSRDGHIFKWIDGGFLITDGWSGENTFKGETVADFREALELLDQ